MRFNQPGEGRGLEGGFLQPKKPHTPEPKKHKRPRVPKGTKKSAVGDLRKAVRKQVRI